jgi:acyl carrier protein
MEERDVVYAVVSELRNHTDAELVPDQLDLDLSLDLLGIDSTALVHILLTLERNFERVASSRPRSVADLVRLALKTRASDAC